MVRLYLRLVGALTNERGSLPEWLPAGMAILAAIVVLFAVMNYLSGALTGTNGWISQIWQHISTLTGL